MEAALGLALAAGLVAALNPCGFAMLPAYLALVMAGGSNGRRANAVARALAASAAMTAGFVVVFGAVGLVIVPIAGSVQRYLPFATVVIGACLLGLGMWLLSGRELNVGIPKPRSGAPTQQIRSMIGYGVAYGVASLSCTLGPFLAVTSVTLRGNIGQGLLAFVAYALGMGLTVSVLAVATALASQGAIARMRNAVRFVSRLSGLLLVAVGAYVTYYGVYEIRVFFLDAEPSDPIIDAATTVQDWLAATTNAIGALPLLAGLLLLLGVGIFLARRRRGEHTADSGSSDTPPDTTV